MCSMRVMATDLAFPEGPVAMPDGSVILVEIRRQQLTRIGADGRKDVIARIAGGPNGAALGPDGKIYVCNNGGFSWKQFADGWGPGPLNPADYIGGSIQRVDLSTGEVETVFDSCNGRRLLGPNDLVFDSHGGLWFTDFGKRRPRDADHGSVYYIKPGMTEIVEVIFPLQFPNGIGLSPDEKLLYVAETTTARLWAFDVVGAGKIQPRQPVYRNEAGSCLHGLGGYAFFDSLAVEACGNICVATLVKGAISVISPDGTLLEQIETGDASTTNIAFGGKDLKTAYITLSDQGHLIAVDWPRAGLPLAYLNAPSFGS
ncbi:MAG: gluconolactonase [Devosia sp.]|uniref:SMP-30/gluconolactonase/LRE family protein n=1 Tax=Devosia sp. TaxID=1871048 RepID=UPI00262856FD|nr:SMP-30/gluconolactonase/LRE family protein [Devosia sp.]MDB5527371.1 gluconolactonase [Devosia sp.]